MAGSLTVWRILLRTNSAAVAFASSLMARSMKEPPIGEAADLPADLEFALALFGRRFKSGLVRRGLEQRRPAKPGRPGGKPCSPQGFSPCMTHRVGPLCAGTLKFAVRWKTVRCVAWAAMSGDRLDSGGTGADDADGLAGEVDAFVRPLARVVPLALVAIEALEVGHARRGEAACGHDAERGAE